MGGILSSNQIKLASGLITEAGFKLKELNNRNVLKLQKGLTTIYLYPKPLKL